MSRTKVPSPVWLLGTLIGLHGLVVKLIDVTSTAGVVAKSGSTGLVQVWALDVLVTLAVGAWLSLLADRVPRSTLLPRLLVLVGLGYLGVAGLLWTGDAPTLSYWLLYMISTAEVASIPVTAWAIAADTIDAADNVRWFTRIAAAESVADLIGYLVALGAGEFRGIGPGLDAGLVGLSAGICFGAATLAARRLPLSKVHREVTPPPLGQELDRTSWLRPLVVRVAAQYAAWVALGWAAMRDVELETAEEDGGFRRWYAVYSMASTLAILAGQALLPRWLAGVDRWRASMIMPTYVILACALAAAIRDPRVTLTLLGGYFVVSHASDAPLRRSCLADLDEGVRGRLAVLLDVHAYAIGSLLGTALVMAGEAWLPDGQARLGVAAAAVAIGAV
ncbi:MAG: hypothetical protein HY902_17855, partial [Deltaproteobacteria bacterium]|nr:hypothetical protein [Deltaproteobacteria bacterium]